MTHAYAVEVELRRLFKAAATLDDIKLFSIGEPVFLTLSDYPALVIFLEQQQILTEETGIWVHRYTGYIAAETNHQDDYEITDRGMDVESLLSLRDYLDSATDVIKDNISLGNLVDSGETVRTIMVSDKTYGLRQRDNNMFNRGEMNIYVETQKPR